MRRSRLKLLRDRGSPSIAVAVSLARHDDGPWRRRPACRRRRRRRLASDRGPRDACAPRVASFDRTRGDAVLVLQRPQLDLWKGDRLTASIATSIDPGLGRPEVTGSLVLRMNVLANGATGEATLYNFELDHANFGDETLSNTVDGLVRSSVPRAPVTMPIARLTGLIGDHTVIDVEQEPLSGDRAGHHLSRVPDRSADASGSDQATGDREWNHARRGCRPAAVRGLGRLLPLRRGGLVADPRSGIRCMGGLPSRCRTAFDRIPDEPRFAHLP